MSLKVLLDSSLVLLFQTDTPAFIFMEGEN